MSVLCGVTPGLFVVAFLFALLWVILEIVLGISPGHLHGMSDCYLGKKCLPVYLKLCTTVVADCP